MTFWDGEKWVADAAPQPRHHTGDASRARLARFGDVLATGIMVVTLAALAIPFGRVSGGEASLVLAPDSGVPGSSIRVQGSAFPPKARLQLTWDGVAKGMPTVRASNGGLIKVTIEIPDTSAGPHVVAVTSATSKGRKDTARPSTDIAGATFKVTEPDPTEPSETPAPQPTPDPTRPPATATPRPSPTEPAPTTAPTQPPDSPAPTPTAPPPTATGFVQAKGTQLTLNGEPYRFVGFNIYNANSRDNCWYPLGYSNGALGDALAAVGPDQDVFRAWFYQDLATSDGVRDWAAFDHTVAVARRHGVRIVATLADQWGSCDSGPDRAVYKGEAWYESGYRSHVGPGSTRPYRDWVAEVVRRYRDEPTILAWQLMNEAEIKRDLPSSCAADGATTLRTWAADVSGLVKSIDPNHLVSLGTLGGGQCATQGSDYRYVHNLSTIDLCEYHDYQPGAMPGDEWNGLAVRLSQCAALDKPLFIGESGQEDMSLSTRADVFASKFRAQFEAGVVGELVWALRIESQGGSSTTTFDVGPSDPVVDLFERY
jgi:hypothetical protein